MPLIEFECQECGAVFDSIISRKEDEKVECPKCSSSLVKEQLSAPSNYYIKGNNSASTRPRTGGSVRSRKK
jgi:putative FmdB family regulatory protein